MKQINLRAASIDALKEAIGENLKTLIKDKSEIQVFCENNDIAPSTLYRLLEGKNVSTDNFFRVLRGLELWDIFDTLVEPPRPRPVDVWNRTAYKVRESSSAGAGLLRKTLPSPDSVSSVKKHIAPSSGIPQQKRDDSGDG